MIKALDIIVRLIEWMLVITVFCLLITKQYDVMVCSCYGSVLAISMIEACFMYQRQWLESTEIHTEYRVAWKSNITGFASHSKWFKKLTIVQSWVTSLNDEWYPTLSHWIETREVIPYKEPPCTE